jgi:uncharacterized protein (TIGR00375 family)
MTRVYSDLHIHSKYSRATSRHMDIPSISRFAKVKGLNLIGTGDFTHPSWMRELKSALEEVRDTGLYKLRGYTHARLYFMVTGEVNTVFNFVGKTRRIHHLLLANSFETAEQISDRLMVYGDLNSDGRPTLKMSASELVEEVMEVSSKNAVIPAHIWTPWFGLFGSKSGFDRIEDCYEDMTGHIFALETGLSSDPPMNWRLSALDKYALVSNSDSHSPYPHRIGREANVLEVERLTYNEVVNSIRLKDSKRFKFTIETNPAYGKYHWTGHRNCNVSMPARESRKLHGICPVCRRPLTRGVEERVEDLADRPNGFQPDGAIGYMRLIPLQEIIGAILGTKSFFSSAVSRIYNSLIAVFGNEYSILLDVSEESLGKVVDHDIAEAIIRVRMDKAVVSPGYDGVYGKLEIFDGDFEESKFKEGKKAGVQSRLERFIF